MYVLFFPCLFLRDTHKHFQIITGKEIRRRLGKRNQKAESLVDPNPDEV